MFIKLYTIIEGGSKNKLQIKKAEELIKTVYDKTADFMNNGGCDKFNRRWFEDHPELKSECMDVGTPIYDEYLEAYDAYFKGIADAVSHRFGYVGNGKYVYLREEAPFLIETKEILKGTDFHKAYLYGYIA